MSTPHAHSRNIRYEEYPSNAPLQQRHTAPAHTMQFSHLDNERYLSHFSSRDTRATSSTNEKPCLLEITPLPGAQLQCPQVRHYLLDAWLYGPKDPRGHLINPSSQPLTCMSLHVSGDALIVGSTDHALYEINLNTLTSTRTLYSKRYGHTEWVTCALYLPDRRILSAGMDSKLCLWHARRVQCDTLTGHSGSISVLKSYFNVDFAFSAGYDKTARIWNINERFHKARQVRTLDCFSAPILDADTVSTSHIMTGDRSGNVTIVDGESGRRLRTWDKAHAGHATCVTGGTEMTTAYSGGQDGICKVWDTRQNEAQSTVTVHYKKKKGVGAVSFLKEAGGECLISAGADGKLAVLEKRKSYEVLYAWEEHADFIYSMHVDGQFCFSGGGDGKLLVHDYTNGRLLYGLGANQAAVRGIGTTEGVLVASGDDGGVLVYDMK